MVTLLLIARGVTNVGSLSSKMMTGHMRSLLALRARQVVQSPTERTLEADVHEPRQRVVAAQTHG